MILTVIVFSALIAWNLLGQPNPLQLLFGLVPTPSANFAAESSLPAGKWTPAERVYLEQEYRQLAMMGPALVAFDQLTEAAVQDHSLFNDASWQAKVEASCATLRRVGTTLQTSTAAPASLAGVNADFQTIGNNRVHF